MSIPKQTSKGIFLLIKKQIKQIDYKPQKTELQLASASDSHFRIPKRDSATI